MAIIEYYAFEAGPNVQPETLHHFRKLAETKLKDLIYAEVGFNPSGTVYDAMLPWLERVSLNFNAAPEGYFAVFNESDTLIYEMISSGVKVGPKIVPDISVGQTWAQHWLENNLESIYGQRRKYSLNYPESHPQSKANPHSAWCYPLDALGEYRRWLENKYIAGGKLDQYLIRQ